IALFDQVDPSSTDWGRAQLNRVEALLKLNDEDDAHTGLEAIVDAGGPSAGDAWLRLGQLAERDRDEVAAEADYLSMAEAAPDRAAEALFHVGFARYVRNDRAGALSAWRIGLGSGGPASLTVLAALEYWTGKASADGSAEAQEAFNRAAAAAPESFYGLRAQ